MRKCVDKITHTEYAVKIIDLVCAEGQEYMSDELLISTKKEINVLRMCGEHEHISKYL